MKENLLFVDFGRQWQDIETSFILIVGEILWNMIVSKDSAKLRARRAKNVLTNQRALRAFVPYALTCQRVWSARVLTCQGALRAYVLPWQCIFCAYVFMCQHTLRNYVRCMLTCSRACMLCMHSCLRAIRVNIPCVLMYLRVSVACEFTCSRANIPWVPCFTRLAWPHDHLPTCFGSLVSSFDATFFSLTAIVLEVVQVRFRSLINVFA